MELHLRESQKMESLGTLAGGIAHDFNNILGAIVGYAELTRIQCQEDSKLENYVSQISRAGNRAAELVKQILWFSRQGLEEKKPLETSRVFKEALKLIEATLPANIEIITKISPDLPAILGNETQIHQIVMNLCTNAYHAMKKSSGTLGVSLIAVTIQEHDISSFPDVTPGNYINLLVSDDGCGIPPEVMNRIFEPYFTTKAVGEGTGLGLSTVHGIVKNHGGYIQAQSEVGFGTTFNLLFPVAESEAVIETSEKDLLPTGNETILLVDDEKALIDLGRDLLERLGYRVETRASSIDAIEAFKVNPQKYDLILSDITMPKMTGDELARHIKTIQPDIPIILCSGFSNRIDELTLETLGVNAILMKPIIYSELAYTIRQVLDKHRQ
jgi:CheY-like chemotaxis protein